MVQSEWQQLLVDAANEKRGDHWLSWLHLGVMYYSEKNIDAAKRAWERSLELEPSPWAYRNMAVLAKREKKLDEAAGLLLTACRMAPQVFSLALECCRTLLEANRSQDMLEFMDDLLDLLDRDPEFHSFLLDSQTIAVEDYLDLRLEREEQVWQEHVAIFESLRDGKKSAAIAALKANIR